MQKEHSRDDARKRLKLENAIWKQFVLQHSKNRNNNSMNKISFLGNWNYPSHHAQDLPSERQSSDHARGSVETGCATGNPTISQVKVGMRADSGFASGHMQPAMDWNDGPGESPLLPSPCSLRRKLGERSPLSRKKTNTLLWLPPVFFWTSLMHSFFLILLSSKPLEK